LGQTSPSKIANYRQPLEVPQNIQDYSFYTPNQNKANQKDTRQNKMLSTNKNSGPAIQAKPLFL
jgi:hypothetical protein